MEHFTNAELAEMRLIYGLAEENVRAAERLYCERYSERETHCGSHNLCEHGSLRGNRHSEGGTRVTRTSSMTQTWPISISVDLSLGVSSFLVPVILLFHDVSDHELPRKSKYL
ncbi:hypothetical protein TNCV_4684811 [Trichonephila clavipes]|nr:hypothetical protein TNCV_4684811 [Trichonephila clavipes]